MDDEAVDADAHADGSSHAQPRPPRSHTAAGAGAASVFAAAGGGHARPHRDAGRRTVGPRQTSRTDGPHRRLRFTNPDDVIAEMLGVPVGDRHKFHRWSGAMLSAGASRFGLVRAMPSAWLFMRYIRKLIQEPPRPAWAMT